jgi:hypothetical protein
MPHDINQETIKHLVGRIQASNYLYFIEDEIDPDDTRHNKPLYITIRCKDVLIRKVLINNSSVLNVLSRHMQKEMSVIESHIRPNTMMVREYHDSPR